MKTSNDIRKELEMTEWNGGCIPSGAYASSGTSSDYIYTTGNSYAIQMPQQVQWTAPTGMIFTVSDEIFEINPAAPGGPMKKLGDKTKKAVTPFTAIDWLKQRVEEIRLTPAMMMATAA